MLARMSLSTDDDLNLEAANRSPGFIDLTYTQFNKYRELLKDGREPLKDEVYKDQAKLDIRRALFGDEEIRRTLAGSYHDGSKLEFLEKKFGKAFSDDDKVRPPSSTYTVLVREKSARTLQKEKKKQLEKKRLESLQKKEKKLADLKLARGQTILETRAFLTDRTFDVNNRLDNQDDLFERFGHRRGFLDHVTPKTSPEGQNSSSPSSSDKTTSQLARRRNPQRRRPRDLLPLDLSLRRLTIRIPSLLEPGQNRSQSHNRSLQNSSQLPPISSSDVSSTESVQFQYPAWRNKKVIRISDEWVALREKRKASPPPEEENVANNAPTKTTTLQPPTISKWRLFSINDQQPPQLNVFVHYQPDGKVEIRRRAKNKKGKTKSASK